MSKRLPFQGGWSAILPCAAAIGGYLFFVFLPGMREIHALRADSAAKQQFLSESVARAARQKLIETEEAETRMYLDQWHKSSAKPGDTGRVFGELAEMFKSAGVETTTFKPEAKQSLAAVDRLPLTVGCTGSHDELQALLASLEQLSKRVWIDELVLERGAEAGSKMKCELKLAIFVDNFEISD
jgi:Tfp pilus assembly protein PilO